MIVANRDFALLFDQVFRGVGKLCVSFDGKSLRILYLKGCSKCRILLVPVKLLCEDMNFANFPVGFSSGFKRMRPCRYTIVEQQNEIQSSHFYKDKVYLLQMAIG